MAGRVDELDHLRERLLELVDDDAEAYRAFARAAEPTRKEALAACDAPLETAEAALAALRLLSVGLPNVPERVLAECAVAAHALGAAVEGGVAVGRTNLALLAEAERGDRAETLGFLRREGAALVREIEARLAAGGAAT
jgi:formiminotetrahydrofolate cyclodeaminase